MNVHMVRRPRACTRWYSRSYVDVASHLSRVHSTSARVCLSCSDNRHIHTGTSRVIKPAPQRGTCSATHSKNPCCRSSASRVDSCPPRGAVPGHGFEWAVPAHNGTRASCGVLTAQLRLEPWDESRTPHRSAPLTEPSVFLTRRTGRILLRE